MKPFSVIFFFLLLSNISFCQDFGCYDISESSQGAYTKLHSNTRSLSYINWNEYSLKPNAIDGYYKEFYFDQIKCTRKVKMEGIVRNGLKEGLWTLGSTYAFYTGNFVNGKKDGLWTGHFIAVDGDSVCIAKVDFKNDLIDGKAEYYYSNGKISKTTNYQNDVKNGLDIEYFENDTTDVEYISEHQEYAGGKLDGKYLLFKRNDPTDTLEYGIFKEGLKNGRFVFNRTDKLIVDYIDGQVNGKFIKYYRNGILAFEMDYKNNLPYNLILTNDSSGNRIESMTLIEGNGTLNCYYDSGQLFSSFEYKDQLIHGYFIRYHKTGAIQEEGILHTNDKGNYGKSRPIEQFEDINLYSAWQLNFSSGTDYIVFSKDGSMKELVYSEYCESKKDTVTAIEVYQNDKLHKEKQLWKGLKYGQETTYYEDNQVESTGNHIIVNDSNTFESVKDGVFKYYYSNGQLKAEITFSRGVETGESYYFEDNGTLRRIKVNEDNGCVYNILNGDTVNRIDSRGKKQGKWISLPQSFNKNNCYFEPAQIKFYKDDNPIGTWKFFSYDGEDLIETLTWENSEIASYKKWYNYAGLREEGVMINQKEHGECNVYDTKRGYLKFSGEYNCGYREGVWREYKKNGKLKREIENN